MPPRCTAGSTAMLALLAVLSLVSMAALTTRHLDPRIPYTAGGPRHPKFTAGGRRLRNREMHRCMSEVKALVGLGLGDMYRIVDTREGFSMAVYKSDDIVSASLLGTGRWEPQAKARFAHAEAFTARACTEGGCAGHLGVDVGANLGWWTLIGAARGWKMVAVEGSPHNTALLRLSLCLNPSLSNKVVLFNALAGSAPRRCAVIHPAGNYGDGSVQCATPDGVMRNWTAADAASSAAGAGHAEPDLVDMRRLDDLLAAAAVEDPTLPKDVALLKLDIEGSEFDAVEGARGLLSSGRLLTIFSEVWQTMRGGAAEYLALLSRQYALTLCSNATALAQGDYKAFVTSASIHEVCGDLIS